MPSLLSISTLLYLCSLARHAHAQQATSAAQSSTSNPTSDVLEAVAQLSSADQKVSGTVKLTWRPGQGVEFVVDVQSGIVAGSQHMWHVHENPISSGDCASAGGILDPAGAKDECDMQKPWLCKEGDLSGKRGKLVASSLTITDGYLRFWPPEASVLGRSMVIHDVDGKPWACGSITSAYDGTASSKNGTSSYQTYPEKAFKDVPQLGWIPSVQEQPDTQLVYSTNGSRTFSKVDPPFVWSTGAKLPGDTNAVPSNGTVSTPSNGTNSAAGSGQNLLTQQPGNSSATASSHSITLVTSVPSSADGRSSIVTNSRSSTTSTTTSKSKISAAAVNIEPLMYTVVGVLLLELFIC